MRYCILALAIILFSCAVIKPEVNTADFVITRIGPCDTTCTKERGMLTRQFSDFDTRLEVSFISSNFNIKISKAVRSLDNYTFSGVGEDGSNYDVTVGMPQKGDAIIGFRKCEHEWIIVDVKCNFTKSGS